MGRRRISRTTAWLALTLAGPLALAACRSEKAPEPDQTTTSSAPEPAEIPVPKAPAPEPSPTPTLSLPVKPTAAPMAADTASALPALALPPRDDCAAQPGWSQFHARLAAAVKARDAAALAALSSADVTLDYGGGHGPAELHKRMASPAGAAVWADLARIMPLGCAVEGDLAVLPWFFWNVPDEVDPGMTMLVTGESVPLRAKPSDSAAQVALLDWSLVTIAASPGFDPAARYTAVVTGKPQRKGWIETSRLRSLLARRIIAERKGDQWFISALVAGD